MQLIETNGGCDLPCWWGVQPGADARSAILRFLAPLNITDVFPLSSNDIDYYNFPLHVNQSDVLNLIVGVTAQNGSALNVHVVADNLDIFTDLSATLKQYAFRELLLQYGKPSSVLLALEPSAEANGPFIYDLWVFYEETGVLVGYSGVGVTTRGETWSFCTDFETVKTFRLYLQAGDDLTPLQTLAGDFAEFDALQARGYFHTWEMATGMSLTDVTAASAQTGNGFCFQSPENVWKPSLNYWSLANQD